MDICLAQHPRLSPPNLTSPPSTAAANPNSIPNYGSCTGTSTLSGGILTLRQDSTHLHYRRIPPRDAPARLLQLRCLISRTLHWCADDLNFRHHARARMQPKHAFVRLDFHLVFQLAALKSSYFRTFTRAIRGRTED